MFRLCNGGSELPLESSTLRTPPLQFLRLQAQADSAKNYDHVECFLCTLFSNFETGIYFTQPQAGTATSFPSESAEDFSNLSVHVLAVADFFDLS
jgi:hypothetical protein